MTAHADDTVTIDHADPKILISAEIVEQAARGQLRPEAAFDVSLLSYTCPNGHVGALLKIRAVNRQVVYRLTYWVPHLRAYIGEWPE